MDDQAINYRLLDEWFHTTQGKEIGYAFAAELSRFENILYGKNLIQLGVCGENAWLKPLHFAHKWLVTPYYDAVKTSFSSSIIDLSVARNSIDCLCLPMGFEIYPEPKSLISELDRVLKPMGYLIILGINPVSFWGAALRWGKIPFIKHIRTNATSSFTIKHHLLHLGYKQCAHTAFYYIPPVAHEKLRKKMEFLNEVGKMLWPFPAGFYGLILQKQHYCSPNMFVRHEDELILEQKPII